MTHRYEGMAFCPHCGSRYAPSAFDAEDIVFRCGDCRFEFYQNSIPSAVAVVPHAQRASRVVLLTRSTPPAVGMLALPGGILKYHESPREGAAREVLEETGVAVRVRRLLCDNLVNYNYQGAAVSVLELAFLTDSIDTDFSSVTTSEASRVAYYDVDRLDEWRHRLAFPEQQAVLECYQRQLQVA